MLFESRTTKFSTGMDRLVCAEADLDIFSASACARVVCIAGRDSTFTADEALTGKSSFSNLHSWILPRLSDNNNVGI